MNLKYHSYAIGITQSGKTTSCMKLLNEQQGIRIFFNSKLEKKWLKHSKYIVDSTHAIDLLKNVYQSPREYSDGIISIMPNIDEGKKGITPILKYILKRHLNNQMLRTTVLVDEIHIFQSSRSLDDWIERAYVMGLGLNMRMIAIAQRPQQIHQTIRNNSETIILHYTKDFDIAYLKDQGIIDFDPEFDRKYTAYLQPSAMEGWKRLQ